MPPHVGPDTAGGLWQPHPVPHPWLQDRSGLQLTDRTPLPRPQMINPYSCWGPSGQRPQFGTFNQEQQYSKIRIEPPRFDGSDANSWIRSVQYYFDHLGTPEAHRLHYVVMLFDPNVADWIWNYCSSHEHVTWYEFLDDVRRRFDPNCYKSYIGLLSKLTQTGTVTDYQLAFEKLQNKVVGVPDHVLLEMYVAGLRQPIQDEVLAPPFHFGVGLRTSTPACRLSPGTEPHCVQLPAIAMAAEAPSPGTAIIRGPGIAGHDQPSFD